ncbi:unnamed protein product [Phytophthora lilii]|uniref:Unnamed protein product n=1 Tax=Phytophthora lilii TaxID=2077276 RepID=A0A9W6WMQ0_9STRA|nr:unnamed protein product [Phytophthora lilii]
MCTNRKRSRAEHLRSPPPANQQLHVDDDQLKRVRTDSPTSVDRVGTDGNQVQGNEELATAAHRDEMVAALLTITSALGLSRETLHLCVGLLDRFLKLQSIEAARLEALSISRFSSDDDIQATYDTKYTSSSLWELKLTSLLIVHLQWTWNEILEMELNILQLLDFRIMAPSILDVLQKKLFSFQDDNQADGSDVLQFEQRQLALYFADLLLLKARANQFSKELLADAIWFVVSGNQIADVKPPLLEPVVLLYLAHRDNINPSHPVFKPWFALRCRYGAFLSSPWKVPYDPSCVCRVCEHVQDELAS